MTLLGLYFYRSRNHMFKPSYSVFSSHACVSSVSSFGVRRTQRKRSWTSTIDGSTVNLFMRSCPPSPTSGKLAAASMKWGEWTVGPSDLKEHPLFRRIILVGIKYPPVSTGKLTHCCPPTDQSGQRKQISTVVFLTMWLDWWHVAFPRTTDGLKQSSLDAAVQTETCTSNPLIVFITSADEQILNEKNMFATPML